MAGLLLVATLLVAFAPRGSESLGYLAEMSTLVVLGTLREAGGPGPQGSVLELEIERCLKGRAPKGRLGIWIPAYEDLHALEPGRRALLFLTPVPDLPLYRRAGAVGKGLWRIQGGAAGVTTPQLEPAVVEILAALLSGESEEVLAVLVRQAGSEDVRVREDAAAELERRCPAGCSLNREKRARILSLAGSAPGESAYRRSLLRVLWEAERGPAGGRR